MTTRTVRPATSADVVALVELRRLMFEDMGVPGVDRAEWQKGAGAWFRAALDREDVAVLVAEVDGDVVASAVAEARLACPSPGVPTGRDALVSSVCTAPGARHQGHARALTETVVRWCRERGVDRVSLNATRGGRAIYEELGFAEAAFPEMRLSLRA